MSVREQYMDDPHKPQYWLKQMKAHIKHDDIRFNEPGSSVLLVIDMQNYFIDEGSHACIPSARNIISNINALIELYSERGRPIVFTRHALLEDEDPGVMEKWWKDTLREGTAEANLTPELTVPDNAIIIRKTTYDAFHDTELMGRLKDQAIKTLVITGVMTHLCCETTARTAFVNDFSVIFVVDATATMNEELHLATIRTLADGFAVPCLTAELVSAIDEDLGPGDADG